MLQALALIAFGASSRLIPHFWLHDAWNLVPIGAIALFAGSRFPKGLAWAIPVFAMVVSDVVMDQKYGNYFDSPARWLTYGTFGVVAMLGILARGSRACVFRLAGLSLSGSVLFFLASNFGVWAWPQGTDYPMTFSGLMHCYWKGLPFFKNTVIADLIGTAALFGLAPIVANCWSRLTRNGSAFDTNKLVAADALSTH